MNARSKLVVGNRKLHDSLNTNVALLEQIKVTGKTAATLAVCAPFSCLAQCQSLLTGSVVAWGAQDVSVEARSAFIGKVAVSMLSEFGRGYVIIGYFEHRSYHDETDTQMATRILRVLEHGITPTVCVDETLAQCEADRIEQVVGWQPDAVLEALSVGQLDHIVAAYEPVRATGTNRTTPSEQAQAMHTFPRAHVVVRDAGVAQRLAILYGGNIKPDDTGKLFITTDIDGGLIGGAPSKAEDFLAIGRT